ncbi:MAG: glycoside hydrolase family 2 protein [Rikenellaceae bacterium]
MKRALSLLIASTMIMMASCTQSTKGLLNTQSDFTKTELSSDWEFAQVGKMKWMPATVPGVVHTDLFANGKIEDPYFSTNENKLQWIENENWIYRTTFTPSESQFNASEVELNFEGLDTYANVFLNGKKILEADNMFINWKVSVKDYLKEGENTLEVVFASAYKIGLNQIAKYPKLPADNDKGVDGKTCVFTRKAQYHYGWDWGPRYVTAGIWKPIFLESYNYSEFDNIHYIQLSQSEKVAEFDAKVTVNSLVEGAATIILADKEGKEWARKDVTLNKGEQTISIPFSIQNPKLWWPNGMGEEKPTLYDVDAILLVEGKKADQENHRLGVRTVKLIREKDEFGECFKFQVNGVDVFMKGANIIPQDMFLPSVTKERYEKLVDIAVETNMNMLRVWGGGIYESDDFYNYCDEMGILLWQDFPFACAFYPWDDEFYNSVRQEATDNIRRLRNHASLAIWCGNNEVDEAWRKWGYKEDKVNYPWTEQEERDVRKGIDDLFFDEVLPGVLAKEDTTRPYHPSSPVHPWGDERSQHSGDVHYWGVFHGEEPFSVYKDKPGRFSNEYGHQSLANYDTWKKNLKEEELTIKPKTAAQLAKKGKFDGKIEFPEAFHVHQKSIKGYKVIEDYMAREVPVPSDNLREFTYLSQLIQGDGIRIAMEGHRQNRPFTMGTLYWQLNDCWPVTSWSSLDYPYGYKALQYFAINSFAPSIFSFDLEEKDEIVELWGITDEIVDKTGKVNLSLRDFSGKTLWVEDFDVNIPANTSKIIVERSTKDMLKGANPKDVVLVAEGDINGVQLRKIFYFLPYKELNFPKADYTVDYKKDGKNITATIKANNLIKAVLFEGDVTQGDNASDAYFDMLPGDEKTVNLVFDEDKPIEELGITVTNLNDIIIKYSK